MRPYSKVWTDEKSSGHIEVHHSTHNLVRKKTLGTNSYWEFKFFICKSGTSQHYHLWRARNFQQGRTRVLLHDGIIAHEDIRQLFNTPYSTDMTRCTAKMEVLLLLILLLEKVWCLPIRHKLHRQMEASILFRYHIPKDYYLIMAFCLFTASRT